MNSLIASFWIRHRGFLIRAPASLVLIFGGLFYLGIRVNISESLPIGVYIFVSGTPDRGDLVFFEPPENHVFQWARDHLSVHKKHFFKRIYGVSGDCVSISNDGVSINGKLISNSKIREKLANGSIVPRVSESGIIPDGFLWVMSEYQPFSFDSRYFGLVPCRNVKSKVKPLLVW